MSELTDVLDDLLSGRPTWPHVARLAEPSAAGDRPAQWRRALATQLALIGCAVPDPQALLDGGGWSERDLLGSAQCLAEAGERKVLSHMALWHTGLVVVPLYEPPRDPRPWLDDLLAIAPAIDQQLPCLVARLVELGALDDALRATWAITWPRTLVDAVVDLAPHLAPDDRRALVDHAWQRVRAWHLPTPYGIEELAELVAHMDAPEARARALSELTARVDALPRADLQTSCDPENPALSLARAVRVCRGLDAAMAELDARLGADPWEWLWCTLELADDLPDADPRRDALGQRALRMASTHHHDDAEPILAHSAWRATRLGPDSATLALDHLLATPDDPQLDEELAIALLAFVEHAPAALAGRAITAVGQRLAGRDEPTPDALSAWLDAVVQVGVQARVTDAMRRDWLALGKRTLADSDELLISLAPLLTADEARELDAWLADLDDDTLDTQYVVRELHLHHPELAPAPHDESPVELLVADRRRWAARALDSIAHALVGALPVSMRTAWRDLLLASGLDPAQLERLLAAQDTRGLTDAWQHPTAETAAAQLDDAWRAVLTELAPGNWRTGQWLVALARVDGGERLVRTLFEALGEVTGRLGKEDA